jgi:diacylglycerol kinase family enzyme/membrane-associated phospholipid phosphatase
LSWRVIDSHAERRAVLIGSALLIPFLMLALMVHLSWSPLLRFDEWVVDGLYGWVDGTAWLDFFQVLADASTPWVVRVLLLLVAMALAVRRRSRTSLWVLFVVLLTGPVWWSAKQLISRPRPNVIPAEDQIVGYSFPSGHASEITAGIGVLIVLTLKSTRPGRLRTMLVGLWAAIGLLVGLDRIFLAVHNPSDVVGGWLIGSFIVLATAVGFGVVTADRSAPAARPLSSMPQDHHTLAIVLNPIKVADVDGFKARVAAATQAAGWDAPLWFETTVDDAGYAMARAAVAAGADVVAVAGGDGTVRVVCSEMAGAGVPVGIIPVGTGNLLARNLGLPLGQDAAVDVVLTGQDRAVDVIRIDGDELPATRFTVMAGLGLDAAIMEGAPDQLKKRIGWPAYIVAGARQLRYPAVRVDIAMDGGEPVRRRARTVVIGNVGSLQAGIPLLPDASIDDGVLDVVVIAPRRLFGWLALALRVITKQRYTDERLDRFTGRSVVVTAGHPAPRQLDGDTVGVGLELRAEVEPGILLVRVPR